VKTAALVTGVFLLGVPGCWQTAGRQPASTHPDIAADLACETARMSVKLSQEMAPAPASDKCTNCDGTGKLGDGRIVTVCPVCKGTGKKP
jgi:DnaJ-class molecular chaperone